MNINLITLYTIFDEILPATDEELGVYWLKTSRPDGLTITFAFSVYETYVDIIIHNNSEASIASIGLKDCSEVNVVDEKRKCLEIKHVNGKGRCFISLLDHPILSYDE